MRLIYSGRLKELSDLLAPYWDGKGGLREDTPDEIKAVLPEFDKLLEEAYEKACI